MDVMTNPDGPKEKGQVHIRRITTTTNGKEFIAL